MEKLDLILALGKATCARDLSSNAACTVTESWNFGAMIVVGAVVAAILAGAYARSRQLRENNYYS